MLYLIYQGNHPDLEYRGGQGPIIHIEADLRQTVEWAEAQVFDGLSLSGTPVPITSRIETISIIWVKLIGMRLTRETGGLAKKGKQAEFLVEREFPWELCHALACGHEPSYDQVLTVLQGLAHKPVVEIKPEWYY